MYTRRRVLAFVPFIAVAGCANEFQDPPRYANRPSLNLGELTHQAVDRLLQSAPQVTAGVPLVVSSITDTQHLDQSSRFGNIVADFVRSRLTQNHFLISEPRLRAAMLMKRDEGEMMLGRDAHSLVSAPTYSCILTGTYAPADTLVYVDLKLISGTDAKILSAVDYVVWRNGDVNSLLTG